MSWVKGDRLKVTLEVIAEEPSDETGDICFRNGIGRSYLNLPDIKLAGGEYTLEVIPKPVVLPKKKWAQVTVRSIGGIETLVTRVDHLRWESLNGIRWTDNQVTNLFIRTISEGVDE